MKRKRSQRKKDNTERWHNLKKKWHSYIVNEIVIVTTYFEACLALSMKVKHKKQFYS